MYLLIINTIEIYIYVYNIYYILYNNINIVIVDEGHVGVYWRGGALLSSVTYRKSQSLINMN